MGTFPFKFLESGSAMTNGSLKRLICLTHPVLFVGNGVALKESCNLKTTTLNTGG